MRVRLERVVTTLLRWRTGIWAVVGWTYDVPTTTDARPKDVLAVLARVREDMSLVSSEDDRLQARRALKVAIKRLGVTAIIDVRRRFATVNMPDGGKPVSVPIVPPALPDDVFIAAMAAEDEVVARRALTRHRG